MRVLRLFLRLVITVLTLSAVVLVLVGGFWYVWQTAKGQSPKIKYEITAEKLERGVLGLYLRYRGDDASLPAEPNSSETVSFIVERGESAASVAYNLQSMGLIREAELFRRVAQYMGAEADIQFGVYSLSPGMTMEEIVTELQHGRIPGIEVTLKEGLRAEEIASEIEGRLGLSRELVMQAVSAGRTDFAFLGDRPSGAPGGLEGFLFPDTYEFPEGASSERVIEILLRNFEQRITPEDLKALEGQQMTLYEVITLASIVEREAVVAEERAIIAGVYLNRLRQGMYLQSDPTVQFAKGYDNQTQKWWNPMKQEEAITVVSPYNTFLNPGLPPGPICNPGRPSILAVLVPEPSDYLFFYAKGDGSHAFAVTYEEHLLNEQIYSGQQ